MTTTAFAHSAAALVWQAVAQHMSLACNNHQHGLRYAVDCWFWEFRYAACYMLKRLFQRSRPASPADPVADGRAPAVPRGVRVYAIGDLHGRLDLLLEMEALIEADRQGSGRDALIVHLGDLVDRGADSRGVVDHLIDGSAAGPPKVLLLGNHDLWLREFAATNSTDIEQAASWMRFGGEATLRSYGVELDRRRPDAERLDHARLELQQCFPAEHAAFLNDLELAFGFGDYFFCHAGIRPEIPLAQQSEADLLWIREPFLSWGGDCGKVVVHGHTVEETPATRVNRIGIDTGACWTGRLTCLVLEGTKRRFLQTAH